MEDGYYLGSSFEIFTPDEIENIRNYIIQDIDYNFQNNKENNDWKYFLCCAWPDKDPSKNKILNVHEIPDKLKQIKEESAEITQSWYFKQYIDLPKKPIEPDILYDKLDSFIASIYNIPKKTVTGFPNVTYYDKNDFIEIHEDGRNPNRICGMLIYLNSAEHYKKEYGGRLFLRPASQPKEPVIWNSDYLTVAVDPISPNMVIFDFTKNNILHAVEKCHHSFYRTAIITFFTLQNISCI